jgi:hypothetical protein
MGRTVHVTTRHPVVPDDAKTPGHQSLPARIRSAMTLRRFSVQNIVEHGRRLSTIVLKQVDSMRAVADAKQRLKDIQKGHAGLFSANPQWDLFMIILLIFTATVTPYEACFMKSGGFDGLFIVNRFVDFGFICDMARQFNTVLINERGDYITDRRKIAMAYLKG